MHSFYINSSPFHCEEDESQSKKAYDFFEKATMHIIGFYILLSLLKTNQPISSWEDVNISYEFICCLHWFPFHNCTWINKWKMVQVSVHVNIFLLPWMFTSTSWANLGLLVKSSHLSAVWTSFSWGLCPCKIISSDSDSLSLPSSLPFNKYLLHPCFIPRLGRWGGGRKRKGMKLNKM